MDNITQNNEEQMEMLLMTLREVKHGICLFQSADQSARVSLIREGLGRGKVIVHDIADDDEKKGMITSQDFRRWASQSNANVVIIYNLQLLGLRFGDEEVVERLNFMRDQLLAIGKLFVFGVSSYFHLLLSRGARDLYSCILHHFSFQDFEERPSAACDFDMTGSTGDRILEMARYEEMKERIQSVGEEADISLYLACMDSWLSARTYLSYQEKTFMAGIAEETNERFMQKETEVTDLENIWTLALTWIALEKAERSYFWYGKALHLVQKRLDKEHVLYADALVEYTNYYDAVSEYSVCEKFCDEAIRIYKEKNVKYSARGVFALNRKAIICCRQSRFDEALMIYRELLRYQTDKYGSHYYGNARIHNNIGRVYEEQGNLSGALQQYKKVLELLGNPEKQRGDCIVIYQNICNLYLETGDGNSAWKYIKKAKKLAEEVFGKDSEYLVGIYNSMSGVWELRRRPDRTLEYLWKAEDLIKKRHAENSELAADVYYNMGRALCRAGNAYTAVLYLVMTVRIREKIFGEKNGLTARSYEMLGRALYQFHDNKKAEEKMEKARNIYISLYGNHSEHVERIEKYMESVKK